MKKILFLLSTMVLFLIPITIDAFAQTTYDVNIPTGAASPDAPYFWQSEKDGSTSGIVELLVGDSIVWKNADTATHTVTSNTIGEDIGALFDSGLFGPGRSFSHTFTTIGEHSYYCIVHPWMEGMVIVTPGYSIIPNVGKQIGDGSTFFDVEYNFNRVLSTAIIDEDKKSITFEIIGNTESENHDLELLLPVDLINGPFIVWINDENFPDFTHVQNDDLNVLTMSLDADSDTITIIGTSVIPEFGSITMMILGISIIVMIVLNQKFKFNM